MRRRVRSKLGAVAGALVVLVAATPVAARTEPAAAAMPEAPVPPTGAATSAAPVSLRPFADADAVIRAGYADLIGRAPTDEELAARSAPLRLGEQEPADALASIAELDEASVVPARMLRLYQAYFRRPPDPSGYEFWVGRLRRGVSLLQVSNTFAASSEFRRTYGALSDGSFVDLVYRNVLGRAADPGGRSYWIGRLQRGTSRGWMMASFADAPELVRRTASTSRAVQLRVGLLRFLPSAAELAADVAELDGPGTTADLVFALMGTQQYQGRYGRSIADADEYVLLQGGELGPVTVSQDGTRAYVLERSRGRVLIVDLSRRLVVGRIAVAGAPVALDLAAGDGQLFVAAAATGDVAMVDLATRSVVRRLALPEVSGGVGSLTGIAAATGGNVVVATTLGNGRTFRLIRLATDGRAPKVFVAPTAHHTVTACPGRTVLVTDSLFRYVAATDTIEGGQIATEGRRAVSCAGTGDTVLQDGSRVTDRAGYLVADLAGFDERWDGVGAISPDATRAYRAVPLGDPTQIEVVDLEDLHVGATLPLLERLPTDLGAPHADSVRLTSDGRSLLVVGRDGLMVIEAPASLAPFVVAPPVPGSALVPTAGRISDVELAPDGRSVWATDLDASRVEVLDATTRERIASIPVVSQPRSISFSPDGSLAYVGSSGSSSASVIEVAALAEVRRIRPQATTARSERPIEVRYAADGTGFMIGEVRLGASSVFRLDGSGVAIASSRIAATTWESHLAPSRSGDRILLVDDAYNGIGRWFESATGVVGPSTSGARHRRLAWDAHATIGFTGQQVIARDGTAVCTIDAADGAGSRGAVVDDGSLGFRLVGTAVQVIALDTCEVTASLPTGDVASLDLQWSPDDPGSVAASGDGSIVAVATVNGVSILHR